jgi:hypothetical protein
MIVTADCGGFRAELDDEWVADQTEAAARDGQLLTRRCPRLTAKVIPVLDEFVGNTKVSTIPSSNCLTS